MSEWNIYDTLAEGKDNNTVVDWVTGLGLALVIFLLYTVAVNHFLEYVASYPLSSRTELIEAQDLSDDPKGHHLEQPSYSVFQCSVVGKE